MKGKPVSGTVYVPTTNVRMAPANLEQQSVNSAKPASAPETLTPTSGIASESSDVHEEGIHMALL